MPDDDTISKIATFLAEESIFANVGEPALRRLARLARIREVPAKGNLYSMGQPCRELHFLLDGQARVIVVSRDGRERLLHTVLPGDVVGAVPFFDGKDYPCSLVADADSSFLAFERDELLRLLLSEGDVTLAVLGGLMTRLRRMVGMIEDMTFEDATHRLWKFLVESSEPAEGFPRVIESLPTRERIAHRIGTVREVVSRRLSRLVESGHITFHGRKLVLHKPL